MRLKSPSSLLRAGLLALPLFALGSFVGLEAKASAQGEWPPSVEQGQQQGEDAAQVSLTAGDEVKARGGNGNGNGNGNGGNGGGNGNGNGNGGNGGNGGGNGNGGNGGGNAGGALRLDVRPDVWNLNWENAEGNLQAFVRGRDAGKIDLDSIELSGSDDEDKSISPRSTRFAGGQVVATFSKSDAIGLFEDAKPGQRRTVTLTFSVEGEEEDQELTDQVRIVGKPDDGEGEGEGEDELHLNIQPDSWNTNWERSAGQVHVFLRGSDVRDIDLRSIVLVGDDPDAEPVEPVDVRRVGKQVVARFLKSEAYASLDDPQPGERHEVKIRFAMKAAAEGEEPTEKELTEKVLIVGPAR